MKKFGLRVLLWRWTLQCSLLHCIIVVLMFYLFLFSFRFTRHMKEPRSGHMQELKRLGRYLVKNRRCVLTNARQTSDETLQVHVDSDWAGDLLGRKSTTGVIVRREQTFVATHVMSADACCIVKRRS